MSKIVTPVFRGSFVSLLEPKSLPGAEGSKPKYQITIVLPKEDKFWAELEKAMTACAIGKWTKVPPRMKSPVKDGDLTEREEFIGRFSVQASSINRPGIVGPDTKPIMDADEIYSGAYYRASIRLYAWEHPTGGKGVSLALDNVMKVKDGEAFSGRTTAEDDFKLFASEDTGGMLD